MKFDQIVSFFTYVKQNNAPDKHKIFILAIKDETERKYRCEELESIFNSKCYEKFGFYPSDEKDFQAIKDEIFSLSLFEQKKVIFIKGSEKVIINFSDTLHSIPSTVAIVLVMESVTDKFQKTLPQDVVILHVKEEKPWQQKERLISVFQTVFNKERKKISKDQLSELIDAVGLDEGSLHRVVENIICYTADKENIENSDIKACLSHRAKYSIWQIADSLLLEEFLPSEKLEDNLDVLSIISAVRFKLQQVTKWLSGSEDGFAAQRAKYLQSFRLSSKYFFTEFSSFLFDLEYSAKNGINNANFLLNLIQSKIRYLKNKR